MRESIKDFVRICAETLPITEPIYEFGAFQVPGQVDFADLRPFFPDKRYIGADMRKGPGVDVVLNLHNIDLPDNSAGTILMMDTIEHVEYLRKAMDEVYRILKKDGLVILSSHMKFPIHDYPNDYWRFTPEAFKSLLKPFRFSLVDYAGDVTFPHTVVGVGFKSKLKDSILKDYQKKIKRWQALWY